MPRVYVEYQGNAIEIPIGDTLLGRDIDCALRFNDLSVSRRHLRFHREPGQLVVEDLGSSNGTLLNGHALRAPTPVRDGDLIQIGGRELVVRFTVDEDADAGTTLRLPDLADAHFVKSHRASRTRANTLPQPPLRRDDRKPIELRLVYSSSDLELEGTTRDLSHHGVFVCSEVLEPLGTECHLTMLIDGGPALQVRGIVRRIGEDPSGLGIEFVDVGDRERAWLEATIARMAPAGT